MLQAIIIIVIIVIVLRYLITRRVSVRTGKNGALRVKRGRTRKAVREDKNWRRGRKRYRKGTRYRRSKLVGGRGYQAPKMCSCGCGETQGKCRETTANAEHWEGMLGARKKK